MKFRRANAFALAAAMIITTIMGGTGITDAAAATKKGYGTATVRVLSTTDLHGQSVRLNYDSGVESEGSLAQIETVIRQQKKNLKYGTTITVDSGDTVYGIGSENIMKGTVSGTEYMYEEMMEVGYDAITLGNHDFDYGVDYIQKALKTSGMSKKVVLSNVVNARTKKNLYSGGKIVTKTVNTTTGKKVKVKIGIVGATVPSLSGHFSWKGIVETRDIVESVTAEAKALKKKGASIIIVITHCGIGSEDPSYMDDNVGYALTAIPEVDCVCAGHTHMDFPAETVAAEPYYDYSETDGDGLMHGKPLVEEADHGASLGITDLKIGFSSNGVPYVKSGYAKIRKITSRDKEDQDIKDINDKYDKQYQEIYDKKITNISGETDNYFGMIEDNPLLQLCNESKIHYGMEAVKNLDEKYTSVPVISATEYQLAGKDSSSYIKVDGQISQKDLLNVQSFNQERAKVYYITGKQLKESLEWQAARFYEQTGTEKSESWNSQMQSLVDNGAKPILANRYQNGWEGLFVYDGIEYTINPSLPARYDENGEKISDYRRIESLTCNGVPVTDDQIFVLVSRHISSSVDPINYAALNKQVLVSKTDHISTMMEDYITHQTVNGTLNLNTDDNWNVKFIAGDNYIIRSSSQASEIAKTKSWYRGETPGTDGYSYYTASFNGQTPADTSGPLLVASPLETETTGDSVTVRVEASDVSGLSDVKYAYGIVAADDNAWYSAGSVVNGEFKADQNGNYTVRATDKLGNRTISYVTIDNIDRSVAVAPKLAKLTNRTKTINGTASPNGKIHMEVSGASYDFTADEKGKFTGKISAPKADDVAELYQTDSQGRRSSTVQITVSRTGANTPVINTYANNSSGITGLYEDDPLCRIMAVSGSTVYIPKDAETIYNESSLSSSAEKVVKCSFTWKDGRFDLKVPVSVTGTKYKVYGVDWIGRVSTLTNVRTVEAAPNQPRLMSVIAEEGMVYGRIPSPKSDAYTITVTTDDGAEFTGTAASDGHFGVQTDILAPGTVVTVRASDVKDGKTRKSAGRNITAKTYSDFLTDYSGTTTFDKVTDDSADITGNIYDGTPSTEATLLLNGTRQKLTLGEDGSFTYTPETPLKYQEKIAVVTRNSDHSMASVDETTVKEALPGKPVITTEKITADTKSIRLVGDRNCTAVLKSGSVTVEETPVAHHSDGYIYKITLPEKIRVKGRSCKVYLKNTSGESGALRFTIKAGAKKKEVDSHKKK